MLYADSGMGIPVALNQIVNFITLEQLPRVGEFKPVWLKISNSKYSDSVSARSRFGVDTHGRDARFGVDTQVRDAQVCAGAGVCGCRQRA